jgi:hypothetical protein
MGFYLQEHIDFGRLETTFQRLNSSLFVLALELDRSMPRTLELSKFQIRNRLLDLSIEKCGIHTGEVQSTEGPREELVTKG